MAFVYVYFAQAEDGAPVKIGKSANPHARIRSLTCPTTGKHPSLVTLTPEQEERVEILVYAKGLVLGLKRAQRRVFDNLCVGIETGSRNTLDRVHFNFRVTPAGRAEVTICEGKEHVR